MYDGTITYGKMKPEVKVVWLDALRGGKYEQTKGRLRDHQGYCCLGVLCDLKDPEDWKNRGEDGEIESDCPFGYSKSGDYELPPTSIHEWAGIDGETVDLLASKNDGGMPFAGIASWIEANL